MSEGLPPRTGVVAVAAIVLAVLVATHISSLQARASIASGFFFHCQIDCHEDDEAIVARIPMTCVGRDDDDHCFRELYRAQLEALEANTWYDEVQAVSPTGASFVRRTTVRLAR